MRTEKEIVEFYENRKGRDYLGTYAQELVTRLSFRNAKPYLTQDSTSKKWKPLKRDKETILKEMSDYIEFAWGKAIGHRGISAGRSIQHFISWLFLLGDDVLLKFAEDDSNYSYYGVPILRAISKKYNYVIPDCVSDWKDGHKCRPDCGDGC